MTAILFNESEEFVAFVDKFAIVYQKMKKKKTLSSTNSKMMFLF